MALLGVGNDLVEIERIEKIIARWGMHFINRIFTQHEQSYCSTYAHPMVHYAARFSAKEAVVKALGIGFGRQISCLEVEIINTPLGKPEVRLSNRVQKAFLSPKILLAITHTKHYASTVALWLDE